MNGRLNAPLGQSGSRGSSASIGAPERKRGIMIGPKSGWGKRGAVDAGGIVISSNAVSPANQRVGDYTLK
jgi:hypothetical protein